MRNWGSALRKRFLELLFVAINAYLDVRNENETFDTFLHSISYTTGLNYRSSSCLAPLCVILLQIAVAAAAAAAVSRVQSSYHLLVPSVNLSERQPYLASTIVYVHTTQDYLNPQRPQNRRLV